MLRALLGSKNTEVSRLTMKPKDFIVGRMKEVRLNFTTVIIEWSFEFSATFVFEIR